MDQNHVAKSEFHVGKVISCRKEQFHVKQAQNTKLDMKSLNRYMKLQNPDMKWLQHFMSQKCQFHVAEKVDFPDGWVMGM